MLRHHGGAVGRLPEAQPTPRISITMLNSYKVEWLQKQSARRAVVKSTMAGNGPARSETLSRNPKPRVVKRTVRSRGPFITLIYASLGRRDGLGVFRRLPPLGAAWAPLGTASQGGRMALRQQRPTGRVARLCPDMPAYARISVGRGGLRSSKLANIKHQRSTKFQNFATALYRLSAERAKKHPTADCSPSGRFISLHFASLRLAGESPLPMSGVAAGNYFYDHGTN